MWLDDDPPLRKQDLQMTAPYVNTPGSLGFSPDIRTTPFITSLGAFITNPISRRPRQPANNRCCLPFEGGFLLHTGWPNPGIRNVIKHHRRRWANAPLPVIAHLLIDSPNTLADMVRMLEGLENLIAIELGLPLDCDAAQLEDLMEAAFGELPIIPCLQADQIPVLQETLIAQHPAAVHLLPPRGSLPVEGDETVSGRLYGSAMFPIQLRALQTLAARGLRLIVSGGVSETWQSDAMLKAGAMAVGLDHALWSVDQRSLFPTLE